MNIKVRHKVSQSEIDEISLKFNVALPRDYVDFLLNYNGMIVMGDSYCTIPFEKVDDGDVDFQAIYSINEENKNFDLESMNDISDEVEVLERPFVIGGDSGGNFYLINANGIDNAVYYWDRTHIHFDDSVDFPEKDEEGNIYRFSDSFESFLQAVVNNVTLKTI